MNQTIPATASPTLDGQMVRQLLGLPGSMDDEGVNRAVAQLAAERGGAQPPGVVSKTLDESLFRSLLGVDPSMTTDQLNADLRSFLVNEAVADSDAAPEGAEDALRRKMGIDKATWDRYGG